MYNKNNIFAKIVNKRIDAARIYEDFINKATAPEINNYFTKIPQIAKLVSV